MAQTREELLAKKRAYYHATKDPLKRRAYYLLNRETIIENKRVYHNRKRHTDPIFRLKGNLRSRLNMAIKNNFKTGSAVRDLGCSIEEFKKHLENKFQPGMSWENYGRGLGKWNIDHIIPLVEFDLTDYKSAKIAFHHTNLQPLWFVDNLAKRKRV